MEEPHLEEYVRLEGVDRSHKVQRVHFQSPYHIVIEDELGMECQPDIEDLEKEAWARICQFCVLEKRRRLTPGINGISSYLAFAILRDSAKGSTTSIKILILLFVKACKCLLPN